MKEQEDIKGHLKYLLQNCQTAFIELKRLNKELKEAISKNVETKVDINQLGALHTIIQDYLIIRSAGLFDSKNYAVSFEQEFSQEKEYKNIKNEEIIKYLQKLRGNFVGHKHIKSSFPETSKILNSNLLNIFNKLDKMLTHKMSNHEW
ncbi:MAG: hypothetical protein PHT51_02830 [Patescibacteria group bacterium]|nr:hypothetical protein [Patescibacteria group bacterium]MDD4610815.1 hypothetical protein [Patescibacteria group bacterium]